MVYTITQQEGLRVENDTAPRNHSYTINAISYRIIGPPSIEITPENIYDINEASSKTHNPRNYNYDETINPIDGVEFILENGLPETISIVGIISIIDEHNNIIFTPYEK